MTKIYKLTYQIGANKTIDLYFDNEDRANRFHNAIHAILNRKGRNTLKMHPQIIEVIDCDEDIFSVFESINY